MNKEKKEISVDNILDEIIQTASIKTKEQYEKEDIVIETLDKIIDNNISKKDYSYNDYQPIKIDGTIENEDIKYENPNISVNFKKFDKEIENSKQQIDLDKEKELEFDLDNEDKKENNQSEALESYFKNKNKKIANFLLSVDNIPSTKNLGKIQTSKLKQMNTELEIDIIDKEKQQSTIVDNIDNKSDINNHKNDKQTQQNKKNDFANQEIDEYKSYEDSDAVNLELKSIKSSIMFRIMTLSVISFLSLYIILGNNTPLPLPNFLDKAKDPLMYLILNLTLLIAAIIFSFTTVINGISNFAKFSSDRDTLPSLVSITCVIQNIALLTSPEALSNKSISLFSTIAIMGLLFNAIGKIFIIKRVKNNFNYVCNFEDKYSITSVCDRNTVEELARGAIDEIPFVATKQKTNFLTNFLSHSFREDNYDRVCKSLSIMTLGIAIAIFSLSLWVTKDLMVAITTFTCAICISSPLAGVFIANLPLYQISKNLNENGCILGCEAGEDFADLNGVLLDAYDLFPKKSINLISIKTFASETIDKVIVDAASVVYSSKSILTPMFLKVIDNKTDILKPVENLVYEDKLGISAWVDNKRVLIGTRNLMKNHNVKVPPKAFEEKYGENNQDVVYLSTAGELTALFIIELKPRKSISRQLEKLQDKGISLIIKSVDCMVTKEKMTELYNLDEDMIKIIPARLHSTFNVLTEPVNRASGLISCNKNLDSYIYTIIASKKLNSVIKLGISIQFVSMILGILMLTMFTFIGELRQINSLFIFIYLMAWFLISVLLPKFIKS